MSSRASSFGAEADERESTYRCNLLRRSRALAEGEQDKRNRGNEQPISHGSELGELNRREDEPFSGRARRAWESRSGPV